jgi:hypothetical protein
MKVKSTFQIIGGRIAYSNKDFEKEFAQMKENHEGEHGEVIFEIIDQVRYFQHKYYRGFLLPDVAFFFCEDEYYVHEVELKQRFLFREVMNNDWENIPSKYRGKCRIVMQDDIVIGYIPSTGALTYQEMKDYILQVENLLFNQQEGHLRKGEATGYRDMAFKVK